MPVYTEPVSNELLLQSLNTIKEYSKVFILGCPTCANLSCNIYQGCKQPAMNIFLRPLSLEKEVFKISELLEKNSFTVGSYLGRCGSLCSLTKKQRDKISSLTKSYETVIVMSCPAGLSTVVSTMPDKNVIIGMKLKGFKSVKPKLKGFNFFIEE